MTPVPLDLPLRLSEAAEIANLIFQVAEGKALTDEVRGRLAARAGVLKISIKPYFGSLERDPVHRGSYYLAVDADERRPMLLHVTLPTGPTSSIFQKPLLVGRTRRINGPEMVINCVPFAPGEGEILDRFAKAYPAFLPTPQGMRTTITVAAENPGTEFPLAFESFGAVLKRQGKNVAALAAGAARRDACHAAVWAAVRAGWREGYALGVRVESKDGLKELAGFSRFTMANDELYAAVRQVRRAFDFELAPAAPVTPEELGERLQSLRNAGHAAQLVAPRIEAGANVAELAAVARQYQCMLSIRAEEGLDASARGIGPVNYIVSTAAEASTLAERLMA